VVVGLVELDGIQVSGPGGLLERLAALPDARSSHGRLYPLAGLLTIAAAAVLSGSRTYTMIGEFAQELPQATLARLGMWQRPYSTWYVAPSEGTLRRVLQEVDPDELDRLMGRWLAEQQRLAHADAVAVDGKTLRGARQADGRQVQLFAALAHGSGTVLAQREVPHDTNEITQFQPLLEEVDLEGKVVTADALHTQADHARWLVEDRHADYVFCVKGNQPTLEDAISRLPARLFPLRTPRRAAAMGAWSSARSAPPARLRPSPSPSSPSCL
jgi:DDE_Tnp_1-associated/Transposase DDE domain